MINPIKHSIHSVTQPHYKHCCYGISYWYGIYELVKDSDPGNTAAEIVAIKGENSDFESFDTEKNSNIKSDDCNAEIVHRYHSIGQICHDNPIDSMGVMKNVRQYRGFKLSRIHIFVARWSDSSFQK